MCLMPAYFTTSKLYTKPNKKIKSRSLLKAENSHRQFLKSMGVESISKSKRSKPLQHNTTYSTVEYIPSSNDIIFPCTPKAATKHYTGQRRLIGIATMHKSNAVPVFADNKAIAVEISQMRRN